MKTLNGTYENWHSARRSLMALVRMRVEAARKFPRDRK